MFSRIKRAVAGPSSPSPPLPSQSRDLGVSSPREMREQGEDAGYFPPQPLYSSSFHLIQPQPERASAASQLLSNPERTQALSPILSRGCTFTKLSEKKNKTKPITVNLDVPQFRLMWSSKKRFPFSRSFSLSFSLSGKNVSLNGIYHLSYTILSPTSSLPLTHIPFSSTLSFQ